MTDRPADSRAQAHAPRSMVGPGPPCAERSGGRSADGPTAALSGGSPGVSGPAVTAPGRTGRSRPPAAGCAGVAAAASKRAHLHGLRTRADVGANELAAAPVAAGTETGQVRSGLFWSEEANRSDCFPKVGTVSRSDLQEPVPQGAANARSRRRGSHRDALPRRRSPHRAAIRRPDSVPPAVAAPSHETMAGARGSITRSRQQRPPRHRSCGNPPRPRPSVSEESPGSQMLSPHTDPFYVALAQAHRGRHRVAGRCGPPGGCPSRYGSVTRTPLARLGIAATE